jgi:hypothetical protein
VSLLIEVDDVVAVFLKDGWHKVTDKSFEIDSYEFIHAEPGHKQGEGVSSTGATWQEPDKTWVACPFPSVLAVKYKPHEK